METEFYYTRARRVTQPEASSARAEAEFEATRSHIQRIRNVRQSY